MEVTLNKTAAALVGVAMVAGLAFAFSTTRAHASQLSDLVELFIGLGIVPADKAADARAALSGMEETPAAATAAAATCNFTRNLKTGDKGADVKDLQKLLNGKGYTVSAAGAGSAGMETEYYGPATAAAVAKMQEAFAADILTPLGLTKGTGFFGTATRAKANTLCAPAATTPTTPTESGTTTDDEEEEASDDTLSGGEASLESYKRTNSPSSVEVEEGDEEIKVAGFQFDVKDGDVSIKRVYVDFEETGSGTDSTKPWDYFDSVSVFLGDEELDTLDASSESDWEDLSGSAYELRFTGLDAKVAEDETAKLYVVVNMASNIDGNDAGAVWTVSVPDNGVRVRDGAGIDSYEGDDTVTRTFEVVAAGDNDELKIALDSSNPNSSIIKVDDNSTTNAQTVMIFKLTAEESDIEVRGLPIKFTSSDTDVTDVVSDVQLEIDGASMGDISSAGVGTTTTFEFDNDEFVIPAGESVVVKVIVDLNSTGAAGVNYSEGTTLSAKIDTTERAAIVAEGKDDLDESAGDITGTAIGKDQQLMTEGIFGEIVSINETTKSDGTTDDALGQFEFKVDVTAFGDTYYVSATTTSVFNYTVLDSNGNTVSTTTSIAVSSTATQDGSAYRIDDGTKKTFTVTVTVDPAVAGNYRVRLNSIDYGTSATNTTDATGAGHTLAPTEDFKSDNLYVNA